jgi:PAS domain S-box-containing protein
MHRAHTDPFLHEKIAFLQQFAENTDVMFWITDKACKKVIFVSELFETLWGHPCQTLYDDPCFYIQPIHPDDLARVNAALETLVAHHQNYDQEYRIVRPDGSTIWVHDRGFPIYDAEKQITYLAGIVENITSRKQTEISLQQQKEQLQKINQSVPGVILQFVMDQKTGEGEITYLSSKTSELLGFEPSQVASPITTIWSLVHPDDLPQLQTSFMTAMQNKLPFQAEFRITTSIGQEKWIFGQLEPADAPDGLCIHHGVMMDISDRKQAEIEQKRAEDALKQKNGELQAIYEAFPDLFFRMDVDGTILDYKSGRSRDLYVPPEVFLGKRMQDILPPQVGDLIDRSILQALKTNSLVGIEYSLPMPNGEEFFEGRIIPLLGEQLLAIVRNISERKIAQRNLEIGVKQQAGVTKLGQQALANQEFKQLMNQAAQLAASGLGVEYCKILELSPDQSSFLLRAGVGWQDGLVGQVTIPTGIDSQSGYALMSKEPVIVEDLNQEKRFSSSSLLESHNIVSGISVMIQGKQRAYGTLCAHSTSKRAFSQDDIYFLQSIANILAVAVERRESELAIRMLNTMLEEQNQNLEELVEQRTAELATFINTLPDYIYVIQQHDRSIQFCNDLFASMTRFKATPDTLGRTPMECFPRQYASTFEAQNLQVFESGEPLRIQESYKLRDRTVHLDTYKIPLKRPDGNVYALITSSRDITELLQARQALLERTIQLEATNHELDSFAYSVSHDLRAPLRHINGFVNALHQELTQSRHPINSKVTRYIQVIENSSHKMGQLIDGLLTLSRVGRRDLRVQSVQLSSLVDAAIEVLAPDLHEKSAAPIQWVINPLPTLKGDPALLQQVLTNLLSNAIKFSRDRHPACIEIGCLAEQILFVKDNGVGFSMKYADQLFGAFQRLHSQTHFEGTGIGLAIVQRIINRHGGKIWAESEPDQGATFYFQLGSIILEEKNLP